MAKEYDPILCMLVDKPEVKTKDASWKAWTLYIDGKWVKSFTSEAAPIREAQRFMKENHPGKVGKLVRNTGSASGYSISGSEYRDSVPAEKSKAKDVDKYTEKAIELLKQGKTKNEVIFALQRMGLTPIDASQRLGKALVETGFKYNDSISSIDKAIKICDASTGHKVVVFVENYLRSIGKNNSTGKYDRIVQGVRSLLSQSLLDDEGLKKASEHEADRLLKKYNL